MSGNSGDTFLEILRKNWSLFMGFAGALIFVGTTTYQVGELEKKIASQAERDQKVGVISESLARQDERIKNIQRGQEEQRQILNQILQNTQRR